MENLTIEQVEKEILVELKEVMDPELMVNVVDLGLIYSVTVSPDTFKVSVVMTLTSKGCPLGDVIIQEIEHTIFRMYPGIQTDVQLVWEPEWSSDMISEDGHVAMQVG
jgi:metal-sulfur cluster biosynthetic enzyme